MKWLREPLVHFLLIGAVLFGVFSLWNGPSAPAPGRYRVVVTPGLMQNLQVSFQRSEQRPPTDKELAALIDDYVREEILNREARALGLDQDDPLIRRQLRQKMEYYLEDSATTTPPTDEQLNAYLQKNPGGFRRPDGTLPPLAEVRANVAAAWESEQRRQTADAAYGKIRVRYTIDIATLPTNSAAAAKPASTQ